MNIIEATAKVKHLEAEVRRLEHALTSAKLLTALTAPPTEPPPALTQCQRDVLDRLIEGDGNGVIAKRLFKAESTVKTTLAQLMVKFDRRTRAGVAVEGVRAGFGAQS